MAQSKVHHCYEQEMVAMGKLEPRKPKCRCRKMVDYKAANEMVQVGEAMWFVVSRERGMQMVTCPMCGKNEPSKSCDVCKGTGVTSVPVVWDTYTNDIVLITHRTKTNKISTPRVATIESEHIERAYGGSLTETRPRQWVGDGREARMRIEEYGQLTQWVLQEFGAEIHEFRTKQVLIEGRPEPRNEVKSYPPGAIIFKDGSKNKSWWHTVDGEDLDKGRAI